MKALEGLILAAGLSSRMGDFKPLLTLDGRSMIGHVIDWMRAAGAARIIIVTGYREKELKRALAGESGLVFVTNPDYAVTQQLASLKLGLAAVCSQTELLMISPADVPFVSEQTIRTLLAQRGDFIRPMYEGEPGHPVFLRAAWIPYLLQYEGGGGLRGAVESCPELRLCSIVVNDRGVVLDNDTPEDLKRLRCWRETLQADVQQ